MDLEYSLEIIEPSARNVVSLNKAKNQVNVELCETHHDDFLRDLIADATEEVWDRSDLSFWPTKYRLTLPRFPRRFDECIYLPRPPLVVVDSVNYINPNGDSEELTFAQVSTGLMSCVSIDYQETWPSTRRRKNAVTIEYTSGSQPPGRARRAIMLLIAEWFDNRGSREIPEAVDRLIESIRPGDEFHKPLREYHARAS